MKRLAYLLLALLILAQTLVNVGIGVYYEANKSYIAAKLCENTAKPEMHCNGQCYLSKMLKKAEENENKAYAFIFKEKEEISIAARQLLSTCYQPAYIVTGYLSTAESCALPAPVFEILQPPCIAA